MEIPYGEFQVEVFLPGAYAQDNIEARYVNGFLYVVMPKMKQQHRVAVRVQKDDER
jgi:HSP20 family molecular chaperone IbpA